MGGYNSELDICKKALEECKTWLETLYAKIDEDEINKCQVRRDEYYVALRSADSAADKLAGSLKTIKVAIAL